MTFNTRVKRSALFILCITVVMSFSLVFPTQQANAAKKMKLPEKAITYSQFEGVWSKGSVTTFKYNKSGQVTKIVCKRYNDDGTIYYTFKLKLKYKKTKKKTTVTAAPYGTCDNVATYKFTINKKGRLTKAVETYEDGVMTKTYTYNKKGFLTKEKVTDTNYEYYVHKGTSTYKTAYYSGKKVKSIQKKEILLMDSYPGELSYYTSIMKFHKNGLLYSNNLEKYKYDKTKKGYVKTKYTDVAGDGYEWHYKTVYTYGKKKATKAKLYKMLNHDDRVILSHVLPPDYVF